MTRKSKSTTPPKESVSFEAAFEKLQEIVRQLESGKLTLDQTLEQYSQGVSHLKSCYAALERAEQRIRQLVDVDEEGNARTRPFGHQATAQRAWSDSEEDEADDD